MSWHAFLTSGMASEKMTSRPSLRLTMTPADFKTITCWDDARIIAILRSIDTDYENCGRRFRDRGLVGL